MNSGTSGHIGAAAPAATDVQTLLDALSARVTVLEGVSGGAGEFDNLINMATLTSYVVAGDWAPAFAHAVTLLAAGSYGGIYCPAKATPYTCKKPAASKFCIDFTGITTPWVFVGEGAASHIQMIGDGASSSWSLCQVNNTSKGRITGIWFDGNYAALTNLDTQTHLLRIGFSTAVSSSGVINEIEVDNCRFKDSYGDCLAIVPQEVDWLGTGAVQVLNIHDNMFVGSHRAGISNQRCIEQVIIHSNVFLNCRGQAIDFEPTTSGPVTLRYYNIYGNMIVNTVDSGAAIVALSGTSAAPAKLNRFCGNTVVGGTIDGIHIENLMFSDNIVIASSSKIEATISLRGDLLNTMVMNNTIIRDTGSASGKIMDIEGANSLYPDGPRVMGNTLITRVDNDSDDVAVFFQNLDRLAFENNSVISQYNGVIQFGVRLLNTANGSKDVKFNNNKLYGSAGGGTFTTGMNFHATAATAIDGLDASFNNFVGCTTHFTFDVATGGTFTRFPQAIGNTGAGTRFGVLTDVTAVVIGGNSEDVADYLCEAAPAFTAKAGSTARNRLGCDGGYYWINKTGSTTWRLVGGHSQVIHGCAFAYTSASTITIAVGELRDSTDVQNIVVTGTKVVDVTASGLLGLDTGAEASNTWYSVWVIAKTDGTTSGLLSLSATAPTMPAGYTLKRRIGWVRNDNSSNFRKFLVRGADRTRRFWLDDTQATLNVLSGGASTTFAAVDMSAKVPSTSLSVVLGASLTVAAVGGQTTDELQIRATGNSSTTGPIALTAGNVLGTAAKWQVETPCNSAQSIDYLVSDADDLASLWVVAYDDQL